MPRTHVELLQLSDQHVHLSASLTKFDGVKAELKDTQDLVKTLEKDVEERKKKVKKLAEKRTEEYKEFEQYKSSGTKRFFYKIGHGGKEGLQKKLEKEEKDYVMAAQTEHNELQTLQELQTTLENSKAKIIDLQRQDKERDVLAAQIAELYKSAFDGPTPDYPEEDAAERTVKDAEAGVDLAQRDLSHVQYVNDILFKAATAASMTMVHLRSADRSATMDVIGFGGIWSEMAERDQLLAAQNQAAQTEAMLQHARSVAPVAQFPSAKVVEPQWLEVVFDNIFTDMMFRAELQQCINAMTVYQGNIERERDRWNVNLNNCKKAHFEASEYLKRTRNELAAIRRDILIRLGEGEAPDAPPDYSGSPTLTAPSYVAPSGPPPSVVAPPPPGPPPAAIPAYTPAPAPVVSLGTNNPYRNQPQS